MYKNGAIFLFAFFSLSCATSSIELFDPVTGVKIQDTRTTNWFSGDAASRFQQYQNGVMVQEWRVVIERKGLSENGLLAIETIPEIATSIGKAATGTSALPDVRIGE